MELEILRYSISISSLVHDNYIFEVCRHSHNNSLGGDFFGAIISSATVEVIMLL